MVNNYHRFTLVLLLAVVLFCITAHFATPSACCAPANGSSCGCQQETSGTDSGGGVCLACMLKTGIRYPQTAQAVLCESIFNLQVDRSVEKPVEPALGFFHPPISQL